MTNTKGAIKKQWLDDKSKSICEISHNKKQILYIKFQDNPVGDVGVNGICMLDIIDAMIDRLMQFEERWPRIENRQTILKLKEAAHWLIEKRENRKLES